MQTAIDHRCNYIALAGAIINPDVKIGKLMRILGTERTDIPRDIITNEMRVRVIEMKSEDYSYKEIVAEVGVKETSISSILRRDRGEEMDNPILILRTKLGISREKLSNMVGCSSQAIYNWETGGYTPKMASFQQLGVALKVDALQLRERYNKWLESKKAK